MSKKTRNNKNIVTLREKILKNGNISLYLDIYYNGQRQYEFLKLYIKNNPKTPLERQKNKEILSLAESIKIKRESDIKHTVYGFLSPGKRKINFIDYFQNFLNNYTKKDIRIVRYSLKHFKDYAKKKYLAPSEINEKFIIGFKDYLNKTLNGETPYNYFAKFKRVCKEATKEAIFLLNPAEEITIKRSNSLKKEILSYSEIEQLAKTECGNKYVKLAFLFCLNTGLRFVDVKNLKWKNIDFANNLLNIQQSKVKESSKNSYVNNKLNNNSKKILEQINRGKRDAIVFILPSFQSCLKDLKVWTKRAGIEKNITWHSARHSVATNLLINGTDIKTVSEILGHSDLKHTQKYTHLVNELKEKAINNIPDIAALI